MNVSVLHARRCLSLAAWILAALTSHAVAAQQAPLTGQMMDGTGGGNASAVASPAAATPQTTTQGSSAQADQYAAANGRGTATSVGDTTRRLLALQAGGSVAGKHLPMLGDQASAAYVRYLKSFEHPIPEFYETSLGNNNGSGSGTGQGR
jgi:hypothetical protein